jgi:hypothetical protein
MVSALEGLRDYDVVAEGCLVGKVLPSIAHQHVQQQRRRPGEEDRAEPLTVGGVEVLVEALLPAQIYDGLLHALRVFLVAISF